MGNMHKNLVKFSVMWFLSYASVETDNLANVRETDRQTRQCTELLIAILSHPSRDEVINHI